MLYDSYSIIQLVKYFTLVCDPSDDVNCIVPNTIDGYYRTHTHSIQSKFTAL